MLGVYGEEVGGQGSTLLLQLVGRTIGPAQYLGLYDKL